MKKIKILLVFAFIVITGILITACGDTECKHNWQWKETISPKCLIVGEETKECTICHSIDGTRIIVDFGGHDWSWINYISGSGLRSCQRINDCNVTVDIGDTGPGGGIIFFICEIGFLMTDDNTIAHYLEAAPQNNINIFMQNTYRWASDIFIPSYPFEENISTHSAWKDIPGTGTAIGTGRKNTALILMIDNQAPAAISCKNISNAGKNDWFLPSIDELNQLYQKRDFISGLDDFFRGYWSSTQFSSNSAMAQDFKNGHIYGTYDGGYFKWNDEFVRAIRAF